MSQKFWLNIANSAIRSEIIIWQNQVYQMKTTKMWLHTGIVGGYASDKGQDMCNDTVIHGRF